jgi:phosphoribosylformylglycinamidine synthase
MLASVASTATRTIADPIGGRACGHPPAVHLHLTPRGIAMIWQVDIYPAVGEPDRDGVRIAEELRELGLADRMLMVDAARGFLLEGHLSAPDAQAIAQRLLADPITERTVVGRLGDPALRTPPGERPRLIHVLPKPGVTDPVGLSAEGAIVDGGWPAARVRTFRKYWLPELPQDRIEAIARRCLANDSIEQVVEGPLDLDRLDLGAGYTFQKITVPLRALDDEQLMQLSKQGQLYLTLPEMQTIQAHFRALDRDPTDIELETIAQTWSEHCSHKTLAGRIAYRDERGERRFENMLKETIFAATQQLRRQMGSADWLVSVFKDNAGVVKFDEQDHVCFKVETHNHPSALEPYGGANTGLGGVIRDPLGTGLGAKPICNTNVFCFAPPDTHPDTLPPGVLHPRRVMKGVVSGVRDYGNRMGIPTVNGAVYFDRRYLGNPLVFCGNVGLIPVNRADKAAQPGDWIVAIGGRTGRDGIHGATFSSAELTHESESISGGAVQIGNAITEKMMLDVILQARDEGLYHAITDCGAGGFSSAVGEMGEEIGAEVWLEKAPLKYAGLSYTEIWISEAQERMVLAVPSQHWDRLHQLCAAEGVEATIIGKFEATGRLRLRYNGNDVGDLSMEFLHGGRPPIVRDAVYTPQDYRPLEVPPLGPSAATDALVRILGSLNVCSKHWIIRQYDHEVQGGSVIKPLVGPHADGPSDAAVVRPKLDSRRGIVIACGMNPHYGDFDPYHMAASAIDEAVRNCVAVGADPRRIAILDNFCWGYTDRPETLGSLVRAAMACHDVALALGTPFISGKDSLNNEFSFFDTAGTKHTISIPPSLLISAIGQVEEVQQCVTMDAKQPGSRLYLIGRTAEELAGSHLSLVLGLRGGRVPRVDPVEALQNFMAIHRAITAGLIRACHDLSEGGLAVAAAEMAFAGQLGVDLDVLPLVYSGISPEVALFSESNSRFLVEVAPQQVAEFERVMADVACLAIGTVRPGHEVIFRAGPDTLIHAPWPNLRAAWQAPLSW